MNEILRKTIKEALQKWRQEWTKALAIVIAAVLEINKRYVGNHGVEA